MLSRRQIVQTLFAGAAPLAMGLNPFKSLAQDKGSLVVVSWGGSMQDVQRDTMFAPFARETGVKVTEATMATLSRVKAMETSNNIEWDVMSMVPGDMRVAARSGLLEKIDYTKFDQALLNDIDRRVMDPYGLGYVFYSKVLAFSTKRFPASGPRPNSWADFWDVQRFPGPRVIDAGNAAVPPIEIALLADGVPPDKLYPLDLDRAYKSLAKIKPAVVKWSTSAAMAPQALIDGEADMVAVSHNRVESLMEQGAPVDFTWNQGLLSFDYWAIPKGAKNYENAMKFIQYALRPQVLAEFAKHQALGPTNRRAYEFISPERAKLLPSSPENLEQQLVLDAAWWASVDASGKSNLEKNQELWNSWILKQ